MNDRPTREEVQEVLAWAAAFPGNNIHHEHARVLEREVRALQAENEEKSREWLDMDNRIDILIAERDNLTELAAHHEMEADKWRKRYERAAIYGAQGEKP